MLHNSIARDNSMACEHFTQYAFGIVCIYSKARRVQPSAAAVHAIVVLRVKLHRKICFPLVSWLNH